ncbi:dihydroorotase [bacterium]|nr:dihydroorotase [bacterium]
MNTQTQPQPPKGWRSYSSDKLALRNVLLIDPAQNLKKRADLIIENGIIQQIGEITDGWDGEIIDGSKLIACPGLFDMHVHLREPGYEHKETIYSGCHAAASGGFTGVAPMPNTDPAIDNPGLVNILREKAVGFPVEVHPIAAITLGRKGKNLSEIGELVDTGVMVFSDDGSPIVIADLMRRALEYTNMFGATISEHSEDASLTMGGVMHEGAVSTRLGLPGWPGIGEEIAIDRNVRLAEFTGGKLHIAHISTAASLEIIRRAKKNGINVTAEVTPHHLTLDCSLLDGFDSNYKVNPPLRTKEDVIALQEGLADGSIDVIATDHAPHAPDEKEVEFIKAPFGMIGLETALGIIHSKLVLTGKLTIERMIEAMTSAPRKVMGLSDVSIKAGETANLTLFNPDEKWRVDRDLFNSKSKNTPFHGMELTGRAVGVINRGLVWIKDEK